MNKLNSSVINYFCFFLVFYTFSGCSGDDKPVVIEKPDTIIIEGTITKAQPLAGIVLWDTHSRKNTDAVSLEYSYMLFDEIMEGKGVYNWDAVENKLNAIAARKHQAIFRFRYAYVGWETSVPAYIKALPDYHETEGLSEGEVTWFPDWTHQELKDFTLDFYTEFAKKYDNDPRLAYIQVGFGLWAEYHIYDGPFVLGGTFPSKEFQEEFLKHMESEFVQTPWNISVDAADNTYSPFEEKPALKNIKFGVFDDSFMHADHKTENVPNWNFFGWQERVKTSPIGGEFSYFTNTDQSKALDPNGPHGESYESFSSRFNITYMIGNDQPGFQTMDRINEASIATGYKFKIDSYEVSDNSSSITIENIGIAPIYYDAYITIDGKRSDKSLKALGVGDKETYQFNEKIETPTVTIECDRLVDGQVIQFVGNQ